MPRANQVHIRRGAEWVAGLSAAASDDGSEAGAAFSVRDDHPWSAERQALLIDALAQVTRRVVWVPVADWAVDYSGGVWTRGRVRVKRGCEVEYQARKPAHVVLGIRRRSHHTRGFDWYIGAGDRHAVGVHCSRAEHEEALMLWPCRRAAVHRRTRIPNVGHVVVGLAYLWNSAVNKHWIDRGFHPSRNGAAWKW